MAEIGTSKKRSLFQNYEERADGTIVGKFNTTIDWKDVPETSKQAYAKPLIKKEILNNSDLKGAVTAKLAAPVTHRLEDVARLTKMVATPQGIVWEAHTAAAQTIQNRLEAKRAGNGEGILKSVGKSLLSGIGLTASTLAQAAVTGTGEHLTPFLGRSYLRQGSNGGVLESLIDSLGIIDGNNVNAAKNALEGTEVSVSRKGYRLEGKIGGSGYDTSPNEGEIKTDLSKDRKNHNNGYIPYKKPEENNTKAVDETYVSASLYWKNIERQSVEISSSEAHRSTLTGDSVLETGKTYSSESQYISAERRLTSESITKHSPIGLKRTELQDGIGSEGRYLYDWKNQVTAPSYSIDKPYISAERSKDVDTILHGGQYNRATKYGETSSYSRNIEEPDIESTAVDEVKTDYPDINLIPFVISSITPEDRFYLYFQANLDSFNDEYIGNWEPVKYLGRAENFYVYNNFTRDISFAFKVVARRQEDLKPIYRKLNMLAGTTAPSYRGDRVFMRGTLTSVTIGDYLVNQYGFFKRVNFQWETDVPWEVDEESIRVPHMLTVNVGFTPIHNFNVNVKSTVLDGGFNYFGSYKIAETVGPTI